MQRPIDLRASERIPTKSPVQIRANGRKAMMALAINISLGGVLLHATPSLPVGSTCALAIHQAEGIKGSQVVTEGVVVRSDASGTAIRFSKPLDQQAIESLVSTSALPPKTSLLGAYRNYFKVSRSQNLEGCEELLGVTKQQFRTVFYTTFCTCIPLAILPVWLYRADIPAGSNLLKIGASFAYGTAWLAVIQPTMDLITFKVLRSRGGGNNLTT